MTAAAEAGLHAIFDAYRAAYLAQDPKLAPFAAAVRYTENNVALPFPDGTWDTVAEEVGPPPTVIEVTGERDGAIGMFTAIRTLDVPGYLAIRLRIERDQIVEETNECPG